MRARINALMPKFEVGQVLALPAGLQVGKFKTLDIETRKVIDIQPDNALWVTRENAASPGESLDDRRFVITGNRPNTSGVTFQPDNRYVYSATEVLAANGSWYYSLIRRKIWVSEKLLENAAVIGAMPVRPAPDAAPTPGRIRAVAPRL